jgi:Flp pilus assembly protein TadG
MLIRWFQKLGCRANISVEFALISVFILLPLFSGGANYMEVICAQSQLTTALQSLYYFAWANPSIATNTADLDDIITMLNAQSFNQIQLSSATLTYGCIPASSSNPTYSTTPCSNGQTQETLVNYQVTSNVSLPLALTLGLKKPYTLTMSGNVQIQ